MTPEPESVSWLRLALAFTVVTVLLIGLGFVLKFVKERGLSLPGVGKTAPARRLQVVESMPLDIKRRLMIVSCDGNEHLLLLGSDRDIVVESNLAENPTSSAIRIKSVK